MRRGAALAALLALLTPGAAQDRGESRLSEVPVPPRTDLVPDRPRPLLELGDPLLGAGPLGETIELPTGAVWQPSLIVFGTLRTALQSFDAGTTTVEWASRLDLFANLQLSGTERLLAGFRPLDENGRFSRYRFRPSALDGWEGELDGRPETLFFEGDAGELFPALDPSDRSRHDWGFAVGRQPVVFQEGLLVDDTLDAVGVTRNTLLPRGAANLRVTGLWAWNDVGRDDNVEDASAQLFGLFAETDAGAHTAALDLVWVADADDRTGAVYAGVSSVQRVGRYNTALRAVGSFPGRADTPEASRGQLVLAEVSRDLVGTHDVVYLNAFLGVDSFSSAARGPASGGPLGRVGVLFEAVGLGSYGSALGNRADSSAGAAVGWQTFPGAHGVGTPRQQLVLELGGRADTDGSDTAAVALGGRYQRALSRHLVLRADAFVAAREGDTPASGLRLELLTKF